MRFRPTTAEGGNGEKFAEVLSCMFVRWLRIVIAMLFTLGGGAGQGWAAEKPLVTLLTLGSPDCLSCRLMEPVLERLQAEYHERVRFSYINVDQQRDQVRNYRLRRLPTLIFYDQRFYEVQRHEGSWDRESIARALEKMLLLAEEAN